ncbi:unnamed protein product [Euphydryas editha]|uniref:Tc1-like transposase DDE domain-containing protein n=1 Tax=Euphydryas editha TaxID=104508 RepID=A0AAU9UDB5_EUPED|nr:unnamed protein product [Euphydryas editha]
MFPDVSRLCLYKHDRRKRVYRRPGERYNQGCIRKKKYHLVEALFTLDMGENSIFIQLNTRLHTAQIVFAYFQEVGITHMEWPARNPNFHPIEHVWDKYGRRIRQRNPPPITLSEMKEVLIEDWQNIIKT